MITPTYGIRLSRWCLCTLALSVIVVSAAFAADDPKRSYDIPIGEARITLQRFAEISGRETLFAAETVRGIRTPAVQGSFTAREAIGRLLVRTNLVAEFDALTGAVAIKLRPPAVAPPSRPPRLPPPPPFDLPNKANDLVLLSPFVVQSETDTGYQANNTLAGSRLNTPIRDLGASVSVYTKDFLSDIGATNANDLLIYATGAEAAGPGGNFSAGTNTITDIAVVGEGVRNSPQTSSRIRGLSAPTYTRAFFASDVPLDSYNTGAVTVNRGPNAILFGVGVAAGVVDTSLLQADVKKNSSKTEVRYGDNDSLRESVDLNRALVPGRLAFRLAALHDEERYVQRPAFETKQRVYGAVTFQPFRTTSLRGNFESGHTRANRPFSVLPFNSYQPWLDAGKNVFDWTYFDDPARNADAADQSAGGNIPGSSPPQPFRGFTLGQAQTFDTLAFPVADPTRDGGTIGTGFRTAQPTTNVTGAGSLAANAIRNQIYDPLFNRDSAGDASGWYETRNIAELPAAFFADNRVPAGLKNQGFTDFSAFDWRHRQIDETGRQGDSFRNFTLTFEQRAWRDRVGLEVAYFSERYERRNRNNFLSTQANSNSIRIDANLFLPDGRPNPNVGRPFVDSAQAIFNQNLSEREARRATGFLRYDFRERSPAWGRWLGRHTATVLAERTQRDQVNAQSKFAFFGPYDDFASADPYSFNRLAKVIAYLGPSVLSSPGPVKLNAVSMPPLRDGTTVNSTFFEVPAGSPDQAKLVTLPYTLRYIFRNGNYSRDVLKSTAANVMSYWLDDHVITTVGLRRDDDYFDQYAIPTGNTPEGLANLYKTERSLRDFVLPKTPTFQAGKEVKSVSGVLRWPQKILPLPLGLDLSVFANTSENFTPNGTNTDAYGRLLPSPRGTTRESGLNLSFLENRLHLRVNRFETTVRDQNLGRITALGAIINNGVLQVVQSWATEVNRNPGASRQADIDTLLGVFPPGWAALNRIAYSGSAATQDLAMSVTQLPNYSDTSDVRARGTEFDLVFNPTKSWRMLVNFAQSEVVQTNLAPVTRELRARLQPALDKLANRPKFTAAPGYVFPTDPITGQVTSLDAGAGEQTLGIFFENSVDVPLANTLAAEGVSSPEIRKYRVNLVTHYRFARPSALSGFGLGGGLRWQDRVGIGYPVSYTPSGTIFIDRTKPYYAPAETNMDFFANYSRRLWRNRVEWKVQLNVRNAIGDNRTIAITAQPDGSPASVRLSPDRRWYLTNTFGF